MPFVDIGSSILKAYLSGLDARRRKEKDATDKQQHSDELKLRQEQAEEKKKEFTETLKQQKDQFTATHNLQKAIADIKEQEALMSIGEKTELSGRLPPGAKETLTNTTSPEQDFMALNDATMSTPEHPNAVRPGAHGPSINRNITLRSGQDMQVSDMMSAHQRLADAKRLDLAPGTEAAIAREQGIQSIRSPLKLEQIRLETEGRAMIEAEKFKQQLNMLGLKNESAKENIRLRASLRPTPGANAKSKEDNAYLSVTDAAKLGLSYGYTKGEVAAMKLTPQRELSPTEQAKENALLNLRAEFNNALALGENTKFRLHDAMMADTSATIKGKLNLLTDEDTKYRAALGALSAEQIHDKYGSVFSTNERAMSQSWIATLANGGKEAKTKLQQGLNDTTRMLGLIRQGPNIRKFPASNTEDPTDRLFNKHFGGK